MTRSMPSSVGLITHFQTLEISDSSVITHHYITQRLKELYSSARAPALILLGQFNEHECYQRASFILNACVR